jgi:hypothetical protein
MCRLTCTWSDSVPSLLAAPPAMFTGPGGSGDCWLASPPSVTWLSSAFKQGTLHAKCERVDTWLDCQARRAKV